MERFQKNEILKRYMVNDIESSVYIIVMMSAFDNGLHEMIKTTTKYKRSVHECNDVPNYAVLYLTTDNVELYNKYMELSYLHNRALMSSTHPDSGVDLYVPRDVTFDNHFETKYIDACVQTKMVYHDVKNKTSIDCGFCIHPRSSISKTELMLANHTGIIDSGYRGNLIGAFRWLPISDNISYTVMKFNRLLQVCHPTLCPVYLNVVKELDTDTQRGSGGFGSSGK